jgi:hypothetical protein
MEPFHRQFPVPWIIPCSSRFVVFPIPTHFPLDPLWLFFSRHWDDQIGLTVQPCPVLSRSTQPALALCMGNCDFGPKSIACQRCFPETLHSHAHTTLFFFPTYQGGIPTHQ